MGKEDAVCWLLLLSSETFCYHSRCSAKLLLREFAKMCQLKISGFKIIIACPNYEFLQQGILKASKGGRPQWIWGADSCNQENGRQRPGKTHNQSALFMAICRNCGGGCSFKGSLPDLGTGSNLHMKYFHTHNLNSVMRDIPSDACKQFLL